MAESLLSKLAMSNGGFAMLALDQRESLRQMMKNGQDREVSDAELVSFKKAALDIFGEYPSAVLIDIDFGLEALREASSQQPAVILAVDDLISAADGKLTATRLSSIGVVQAIESSNPDALKFLLLWSESQSAQERLDLAGSFVDFCKLHGLPSVLESIVRAKDAPTWADPDAAAEAMLKAASELSTLEADLFKCEVPGHGLFDADKTTSISKEITALIGSPWVVLSNGTTAEAFPSAVRASCAGGASGFLAGRAIWADALKDVNPGNFMKTESLKRLFAVKEIVNGAMAERLANQPSA